MPLDMTALNQSVTDLTAEVAQDETVEASAVTLINGFAAAISAALASDATVNQAALSAVQTAITTVTGRFVAARTPLAAAIVNNTPSPTPTPA